MQLTKKSLEILDKVHPDLKRVILRAVKDYPDNTVSGTSFIVTEGMRTKARQAQLFASGATKTMNSRHLTGHAVDLAVLLKGKVRWDWPLYENLSFLIKAAAASEKVFIAWGGDWKSFKDGPHYELDRYKYPKK
jgi:peptidoglycan L-alanyl-D-glutamate endopeptidase CwlK